MNDINGHNLKLEGIFSNDVFYRCKICNNIGRIKNRRENLCFDIISRYGPMIDSSLTCNEIMIKNIIE